MNSHSPKLRLCWFSCLALLAAPALRGDEDSAPEALPAGVKLESIEVYPAELKIENKFAYAQILVTAKLENGDRMDGTRLAKIEMGEGPEGAEGRLVEVSMQGLARGRKDGEGTLRVTLGGLSTTVPVKVSGQKAEYKVSFVRDVMPVLSKIGCNSGTCHGSQKGQNGFKLSLRGNDAHFDHRALTDDMEGRRFNRAAPDRSLFLMKVSGAVPHVGGVQARPGEPYYEILRSWVADGVRLDLESPRVVKLDVLPRSPTLPMPGMKQQMAVTATYSDGAVRDVSAEAILETSNMEVTKVEKNGVVTALRRGEAAVLARFEGRYSAAPLFVMGDRSGFEWKDMPEYNYIDSLVYRKLKAVKTLPSDVASDPEFLRRIYLDLVGLQPNPREVRSFLMDTRDSRKKREEVIDRLIGSAEFVEHWTNKWSDLLQVNSKFLGPEGAGTLRKWVSQAVASNMPYDQFAHAVLASSGSTKENPPASYYKVLRKPEDAMENTTQLFLGVRFNCNKCHDHPFERWTQNNYWELSAFFSQVGRKDAPGSPKMPQLEIVEGAPAPPAYEEIIFDQETGDLEYPKGGVVLASVPYKHDGGIPEAGARRERLATWLASSKNPYFARSFVNRLWSYFLGVGIIDPVDDIRAGNPPSNPALLDKLTEDFIESGFDTRKLMRLITSSRVYQHSISTNKWNEDDSISFSHAIARRLPAETLYDAIHQATGSMTRIPGMRLGATAAELPDPSVKTGDGFLDLFGRPPRESACECERVSGMSLGQALSLVNGPTVAESIKDPQNSISNLVSIERNPGKIVEELFVSFLCRPPTEKELEVAKSLDGLDPANAASLDSEDRKMLDERLAAWEKAQTIAVWTALEPGIVKSAGGATFAAQPDGSVLASGTNPDKDTVTLVAWTSLEKITGVRLEVLPHDGLKAKGPGRSENGNFVLSELRVVAAPVADPAQAKAVVLQNAVADFSQEGFPAAAVIDGKTEKGWAILPQVGKEHEAVFETKEDVGAPGGTILTVTLDEQFGQMHTIGRFRLSVTASPRPVRLREVPEAITAILLTPAEKRSPEQVIALTAHFLRKDPELVRRIRLANAQDLAWALANSPAFLFNR